MKITTITTSVTIFVTVVSFWEIVNYVNDLYTSIVPLFFRMLHAASTVEAAVATYHGKEEMCSALLGLTAPLNKGRVEKKNNTILETF